MVTSDALNELAAALAKAQGEMKNASLNKVNPHFKSRYADLAEIRNTVIPSLSKNGIAVVQAMGVQGNMLIVSTRLIHASGQWVQSDYPIPAGGKQQEIGSAITYARRYTLSSICGISSDDDDDDDGNEGNKLEPGEMPAAIGTKGASKAATRDDYAKMTLAIRNAATLKALADWYETNITTINGLPADWLDELRIEYSDRKGELTKALAK